MVNGHLAQFVVALVLTLVSVVAETQPAARRQLIGRVVDSAGGSIPGAFVTVRPSEQTGWLPELEAVSDDAGRFRFGDVPPGAYRVAGHRVGFQLSHTTVEVAADRDRDVSVVLVIGAVVECVNSFPSPVRIRTRSGEPLPMAFLTVTRAGHRPMSHVVPPTGSPDQCFAPATEDHVTLDVLGFGEHILKQAGVEPEKVTWQIAIEPSAASRVGRATRASATGHVRGRVFDEFGASIPDASVSFQPLDPRSGLTPFEAVADSRGRFDFIRVRPGTYRVTGKALGFDTTDMIQEVAAGVETDVTVVVRRRPDSHDRIPRMRFAPRLLVLLAPALLLTLPSSSLAQSPPESRRLEPPRISTAISLDGRLDESVWETAALAKGFIQNDPHEGAPATFDTEVRVVYDNDAIYLGVFARDDAPQKLIVSELRKDFDTGRSDAFIFIIDSFRDGRNGYMFAINPGGAKWDAQMSNEGRETNGSWDGIWDVVARVGDDGWYAEVRVPFKTMKFKPEETQTWGINFQRRNRRANENSFWSPIPRIQSLSRVSLAGTLENLQQVRPGRNFRLKPWALASATSVPGRTTGDSDAGLDLKVGITNGLTFDATVNTDFSQVEADEQQINLTRFSLFFPEKREFFLENSGVFQFGAGGSTTGGGGGGGRQNPSQDMTLFFSRQIGLSSAGDALPILAGLRLTGRAGPFSVGVLNVAQRRHDGVPATNFTALRLRRDIFAASDIGVMVLNKDGATTNRVVGADANFRFFTDLRFNTAVARSESAASVTPGSGRDWYTRTSAAYRNARWDTRVFYQTIGERFNDEMGFVPRRAVNNGLAMVGVRFRPKWASSWLRETFPHWQIENFSRQHGGGTESRYQDWHLPLTFQDSTFVEIGVNPNTEVIREAFPVNRQRGINVAPGRYKFNEYFAVVTTNSAARLSGTARVGTGDFYDGERTSYTLGGTLRANAHFNLSVNATFNNVDLPAGAFTTTLVTTRVNYFFTTKMYVNALVQYNSDARQWSSNVRFNFIHRPLSDFYLVFNERRHSVTGDLIDRALVAKFTYLMAF